MDFSNCSTLISMKLVACQDTALYALQTKTSTNPRDRTPSKASRILRESEQSIRMANTCAFSSLAISSANLDSVPVPRNGSSVGCTAHIIYTRNGSWIRSSQEVDLSPVRESRRCSLRGRTCGRWNGRASAPHQPRRRCLWTTRTLPYCASCLC